MDSPAVLFWISKVCEKGNRWPCACSVEHEVLRIQGNTVYSCLGRETLITKLVSAGGVWSLRLCKVRRLHRYEGEGRLCELPRLVPESKWVFMQLTFQVKGDHLLLVWKKACFALGLEALNWQPTFIDARTGPSNVGFGFFFFPFCQVSSFLTCCFSYVDSGLLNRARCQHRRHLSQGFQDRSLFILSKFVQRLYLCKFYWNCAINNARNKTRVKWDHERGVEYVDTRSDCWSCLSDICIS